MDKRPGVCYFHDGAADPFRPVGITGFSGYIWDTQLIIAPLPLAGLLDSDDMSELFGLQTANSTHRLYTGHSSEFTIICESLLLYNVQKYAMRGLTFPKTGLVIDARLHRTEKYLLMNLSTLWPYYYILANPWSSILYRPRGLLDGRSRVVRSFLPITCFSILAFS